MTLSLIVHGGAWDIPEELAEAHKLGCKAALLEGWRVLESGGHALDAVEAAINTMEDDPALNAGTGSVLNTEGQVWTDAGIMEGAQLKAGAVAAVQGIRNPISLARLVLGSENVLLVGDGAARFGRAAGVEECSPEELIVETELRRWESWRKDELLDEPEVRGSPVGDTVGAVALDRQGNIAAGNSTGGRSFKDPGRVGDSPLVGCGFYAENGVGGVACTGGGEAIIRVVLARTAVDLMRDGGSVQEAATKAIKLLKERVGGRGGLVLLDRLGNPGFAFNTGAMAHAYVKEGMEEPVVSI